MDTDLSTMVMKRLLREFPQAQLCRQRVEAHATAFSTIAPFDSYHLEKVCCNASADAFYEGGAVCNSRMGVELCWLDEMVTLREMFSPAERKQILQAAAQRDYDKTRSEMRRPRQPPTYEEIEEWVFVHQRDGIPIRRCLQVLWDMFNKGVLDGRGQCLFYDVAMARGIVPSRLPSRTQEVVDDYMDNDDGGAWHD